MLNLNKVKRLFLLIFFLSVFVTVPSRVQASATEPLEGEPCTPIGYCAGIVNGALSGLECDKTVTPPTCKKCGVAGNPCCFGIGNQCQNGAACVGGMCFAIDASCSFRQPWEGCAAGAELCKDPGGTPLSLCCGAGMCPSVANLNREDPGCDGGKGIATGFGCLSVEGGNMIQQILGWAIGIGATVSVIMILVAAFQITTAQGDAKRVKAGQELVTAALTGLFLIIFSVVFLNFIGIKILDLGGLGFQF